MTVRPCWTCKQPATHTLTREGSNSLHACDNCTRIDRAEAESRGWTVSPLAARKPAPCDHCHSQDGHHVHCSKF